MAPAATPAQAAKKAAAATAPPPAKPAKPAKSAANGAAAPAAAVKTTAAPTNGKPTGKPATMAPPPKASPADGNKAGKPADGKKKAGKPASKPAGKGKDTAEWLRQEIKALGGDDSDLALVAGVDDNDDDAAAGADGLGAVLFNDGPPATLNEKQLVSELKQFMQGLGLDKIAPPDDDDDEDDNEGDAKADSTPSQPEPTRSGGKTAKVATELVALAAAAADARAGKSTQAMADAMARESDDELDADGATKAAAPGQPAPAAPTVLAPASAPATRRHAVTPAELAAARQALAREPPVQHKRLLVDLTQAWYEVKPATAPAVPKSAAHSAAHLMARAEQVLEQQSALFETKRPTTPSEREWMSTVIKSGTLTDKIAALTLMVQEGPVFRTRTLDTLVTMAGKKGRREAILAADALKDLFMNTLLPERKLVHLADQPLTDTTPSDAQLLMWAYEDHLKRAYFQFLQALESLLHDPVLNIRRRVVTHVFELLAAKPEQERNLLALLTDKLRRLPGGQADSERQLAAKVTYLLGELLVRHPNMKLVVVRAVEQLIFRPKVSPRAQYYGLVFLNQIILTSREGEVANRLIDIYFSLFRALVNAGDVESRMLSALLTGVNRAYPFASVPEDVYEEHVNTLFRIVHVSTFKTAVQALLLILHVVSSRQAMTDRFYRTLYEFMLKPQLATASSPAMLLNLLYKALKADPSLPRAQAFAKRLLQIAIHQQPAFAAAVLLLFSELLKHRPALWLMVNEPPAGADDDMEHFGDADKSATGGASGGPAKAGAPGDGSTSGYDPRRREPAAANADKSAFWELRTLSLHFHPSVAKFASTLLTGVPIEYPSNPLEDFALNAFLDRFVFKNPKKNATGERGSSLMQPTHTGTQAAPTSIEAYLKLKAENLRADEVRELRVFLHKYATDKAEREKKLAASQHRRKAKKGDDEDAMDEDDVEGPDAFADAGDDADDADLAVMENASDADEFEDGISDSEVDAALQKSMRPEEKYVPSDDEDDDLDLGSMSSDDDDEALDAAKSDEDAEGSDMDEDASGPEEDEEAEREDVDEEADEEEDENDDDDDDDDDDDGLPFSDEEGGDEEDESDEEEAPLSHQQQKKRERKGLRNVLDGIDLGGSTFASAEDFAHLLDEEADAGRNRAARKQADWEERGEWRGKARGKARGGRGGRGGGGRASRGGAGKHGATGKKAHGKPGRGGRGGRGGRR